MRLEATRRALGGRDRELATLRAALAAAERGAPAVILLAGEAGIGKTSLARTLEREAEERAFVVLSGDCVDPGGADLAYAPLVAALRDVRAMTEPRVLADLGPEAVRELARLLPGLGDRGPAPVDHGALAQTRLFELLLVLLRRIGEDRPVVLALDDLHWADGSTRTFLSFLARGLRRERLLVLGTYRSDDVHGAHPLRAAVSELVRLERVTHVRLERLDRDATAAQLREILGHAPPTRLVDQVHGRSGGNPFFTEALVAASEPGSTGLPDTVRDALLLRAEQVPDPDVLRALAVLGRPAVPSLIARVAGMDAGEARAALRAGLRLNLLELAVDGRELAFRHALMRDALYADLLPDEREALHREVVAALDSERASSAGEIAHHAHAGGLAERALRASIEAGLAAEAVYAYPEASTHFERALAAWGEVRDVGDLALDRVDLLAHTAEAQRYTGDYERAITACREAIAAVDRAREPIRAAALLERLGQYHFADDALPLACYDEALTLLPAEASAARARVLAARGMALLGLSRHDAARRACEEAIAVAVAAGAAAEEGPARGLLGLALGFLGDGARAEAELVRAQALAEAAGRAEDLVRLQAWRAEVLRLRGDTPAALQLMLDGIRIAGRVGVAGSFGRFIAVHVAEDLFNLGRWDEAAERLAALAGEQLEPTAALMHAVTATRLAAARGDAEAARREAGRARELAHGAPAEQLPGLYAATAELMLWAGDPEAALTEVLAGLATVGERADALNTPVLHWLGVRAQADLADHARRSKDARVLGGAASLLDELEALVAAECPPLAHAHLLSVRAEDARGRRLDSSEAWREAAAAWERLVRPYESAYARWRAAEALLATGARGPARVELADALATAIELGADPLCRELRALARRARVELNVAPPVVSAPAGDDPAAGLGLTARELEVLALLADGLTNREIGARLFMAPKTAGVHVSRILAKLDARNRVEAAGVAQRLGLLAET